MARKRKIKDEPAPPPSDGTVHIRRAEGGTVCNGEGAWTWIEHESTCQQCRNDITPTMRKAIRAARQVTLFDLPPGEPTPSRRRWLPPWDHPRAVHSVVQPLVACKAVVRALDGTISGRLFADKTRAAVTDEIDRVTCRDCVAELNKSGQLKNQMLKRSA